MESLLSKTSMHARVPVIVNNGVIIAGLGAAKNFRHLLMLLRRGMKP